MVIFPNKKHPLLMVKLRDQLGRLTTSLLSLTLVSAVLMLGSPALAHELSGSTCGADVVFLWDQKHFAGCGRHGGLVDAKEKGQYCGGAASMRLASEEERRAGLADKDGFGASSIWT